MHFWQLFRDTSVNAEHKAQFAGSARRSETVGVDHEATAQIPSHWTRQSARGRAHVAIGALGCALGGSPAHARITGVEIASVEPFADGAEFGAAGSYERVIGTARGEFDPADPAANAEIVDIALAPRNARGLFEYRTNLFIFRPKDPARGNGTLLFEVPNRGRKFLFDWVLDAPAQAVQAVNDPKSATDAGTGLVLRRGDREGSQIPFARTRAERIAKGDHRPSIEERYPDADAYLAAVTKSVDALVSGRLLLREDGDRMIEAARPQTP